MKNPAPPAIPAIPADISLEDFCRLVQEFKQSTKCPNIRTAVYFRWGGMQVDMYLGQHNAANRDTRASTTEIKRNLEPLRDFFKGGGEVRFAVYGMGYNPRISLTYTPSVNSVYRSKNSPWGVNAMFICPERYSLAEHHPYLHGFIAVMRGH